MLCLQNQLFIDVHVRPYNTVKYIASCYFVCHVIPIKVLQCIFCGVWSIVQKTLFQVHSQLYYSAHRIRCCVWKLLSLLSECPENFRNMSSVTWHKPKSLRAVSVKKRKLYYLLHRKEEFILDFLCWANASN